MIVFLKNLLKAPSTGSVWAVSLIFKWNGKRWSGFKITKNVIDTPHTSIAFKSSMQTDSSISPSIEISGAMNAWLPLFKTFFAKECLSLLLVNELLQDLQAYILLVSFTLTQITMVVPS